MERRKANEVKAIILEYLKENDKPTAKEIAEDTNEEVHNISNALLRLRRSQLIARSKEKRRVGLGLREKRVYVYSIKAQGIERLEWYERERR